jgi:hypothetical protein
MKWRVSGPAKSIKKDMEIANVVQMKMSEEELVDVRRMDFETPQILNSPSTNIEDEIVAVA